jgi:hypothetical protein
MSEVFHVLHIAKELVEVIDREADGMLPQKIASTVKACSKGAAVASVAAGVLPGVGGIAAVTASAGFIWGMYVKINSDIGLSISSNILKTLASGIATNLVMYATGCLAGVALASVASFIPVVGTAVSCATMGLLCYVLTLASGYVYLKLLVHLFRAGKDINKMSADELKSVAKDVCSKDEIKNVMKEAKAEYKIGEKNGEFKQAE